VITGIRAPCLGISKDGGLETPARFGCRWLSSNNARRRGAAISSPGMGALVVAKNIVQTQDGCGLPFSRKVGEHESEKKRGKFNIPSSPLCTLAHWQMDNDIFFCNLCGAKKLTWRLTLPAAQFPIPNSQFPIPNSLFMQSG